MGWHGLTAILLVTTSCFAMTDLDRFESRQRIQGNFVDLGFTLRGMDSHVNEYVEYRVVDGSNFIQSRGIFRPLGGVNVSLFAPGAVPRLNGPFSLRFFADHNLDGVYTPPRDGSFADHAWVVALDPEKADDNGVLEVVFDHSTSFQDIEQPAPSRAIGADAVIHLVNLGEHVGRRLQVRVADASSRRVVGLYRNPLVQSAAFDAIIEGMIDGGVTYTIEVYTDDPRGATSNARAYRFEQPSNASGLVAEFDPAKVPIVSDALPP